MCCCYCITLLRDIIRQALPSSLPSQLFNVKETPQAATEEEVGAFTKLIEAMGFTGPLKYNKWVSASSIHQTTQMSIHCSSSYSITVSLSQVTSMIYQLTL